MDEFSPASAWCDRQHDEYYKGSIEQEIDDDFNSHWKNPVEIERD